MIELTNELLDEFQRCGTLLVICPGCGNWTTFQPIRGDQPTRFQLSHQSGCQLSDVRALAEGRLPAGAMTIA